MLFLSLSGFNDKSLFNKGLWHFRGVLSVSLSKGDCIKANFYGKMGFGTGRNGLILNTFKISFPCLFVSFFSKWNLS